MELIFYLNWKFINIALTWSFFPRFTVHFYRGPLGIGEKVITDEGHDNEAESKNLNWKSIESEETQ